MFGARRRRYGRDSLRGRQNLHGGRRPGLGHGTRGEPGGAGRGEVRVGRAGGEEGRGANGHAARHKRMGSVKQERAWQRRELKKQGKEREGVVDQRAPVGRGGSWRRRRGRGAGWFRVGGWATGVFAEGEFGRRGQRGARGHWQGEMEIGGFCRRRVRKSSEGI
jgi:hypothetical protein